MRSVIDEPTRYHTKRGRGGDRRSARLGCPPKQEQGRVCARWMIRDRSTRSGQNAQLELMDGSSIPAHLNLKRSLPRVDH